MSQRAVGRHDVRRDQVVHGQPELPADPAKTSPEREAGNTGGRVDPEWRREAERLRLAVELPQRDGRLDPRRACLGVDPDGPHG
jgi:hypothetical protein